MKKFILKGLLFLSPIVFSQPLLDHALSRSDCSMNYPEWNDIVESKINADLIIQGSSRSWVHFSPMMFDSVFKMNTYNLGLDGYHFTMQYYRFLLYMKYNKKPKYIIQTTDAHTLVNPGDLYMYEQFIPYLNEKIIREAVVQHRGLNYGDIYVPFYKYIHHKDLFDCAYRSLTGKPMYEIGKYKGFIAVNAQWDPGFANWKKTFAKGWFGGSDSLALTQFDTFVRYCRDNDIKLIFVNPPTYFESIMLLRNRNEIDSIYRSYSKKYSIPFLDYTDDSIGLDTTNFYNSQHLNVKGVTKFNRKLSEDLKGILGSPSSSAWDE